MTENYDIFTEIPRTWRDALRTGAVGLVVFGLLSFFPHPLIHPSICEDVAVAAGLRPPVALFPGIYRLVAALLFHAFPADTALDLLRLLGRLGITLAATGVFVVFRELLPVTFRRQIHMRRFGGRVGNIVAAVAAVLFVCADPIWRAGQFFSPTTVFLVFTVSALVLFFRFVRKSSVWSLYICFVLLGMISTETVIGFLLTLLAMLGMVAAIAYSLRPDTPLASMVNPLVDQLARVVVFKRIVTLWGVSFAVTITLNAIQFVQTGGMEAAALEGVLDLLFAYLKSGCSGIYAAATLPGWLFGVTFSAVPLLLAVRLLPYAWDDERFLPYLVGISYLVLGAAALSQLSGVETLKFWNWASFQVGFASDVLLAFFLLLDVAVVAFALGVFGIDACCRNYRRIAQRQYPEMIQFTSSAQLAQSLDRARRFRRSLFGVLAVVVPLCAVLSLLHSPEREAEKIVCGYIDEVMKETEGCDTVFTDGSLDLYLELEALRRGRTLYGLSLLAPNTAREKMVRLRAAENDEDRVTLDNNSVSALRAWIEARSKRLDRTAVQLGFELWQKANIPLPPLSGLVALPGGLTEKERERALAACRALGDRAYALATGRKQTGASAGASSTSLPEGDSGRGALVVSAEAPEVLAAARLKSLDPAIKSAFSFVLWRLARLSRMRSRVADGAGRRAEALRAAAEADELDTINPHVQSLRKDKIWQKWQGSVVLTPREGLEIGLARADFSLAGRYAVPVLATDPDDPRANFAMGMMHYINEQYAQAESYLLRCLVRRSDDAAVLNNLALVQMKIGKLDEAEEHALKAVARLPDSVEVKQTLEKVREQKNKLKTNKTERRS